MFTYKAHIIDCYDGDSITAIVDLGFKISMEMKVRLYGIQTPEIRTKDEEEKKAGIVVRDYVRKRIFDKKVIVKSEKDKAGKFGRYLLKVFYEEEGIMIDLNNELVDKGYALSYYGEKKVPFTKEQLRRINNEL